MRRRPAISSTSGTKLLALPVRRRVVGILLVDAPPRRDLVVHVPRQLRIPAGCEGPARSLEVGVGAEQPIAALDPQRRGAIVESGTLEVGDDLILDHELASAEVL